MAFASELKNLFQHRFLLLNNLTCLILALINKELQSFLLCELSPHYKITSYILYSTNSCLVLINQINARHNLSFQKSYSNSH